MDLASSNEVKATPTLFINGHRVQGVKNAAQLHELIAEAEKETAAIPQDLPLAQRLPKDSQDPRP
jgi:hypothetical protein